MLSIYEATGPRVSRRTALCVGSLALANLTLADLLRRRARAATGERGASPARATTDRDTAVIQIFMGGGPSHIDMFDLKPDAPAEVRGPFRPIATSIPGVHISEHLPNLARTMDKLALVRSVTHGNASHLPASHWMMTGYEPPAATTANVNPSCGSVVACGEFGRTPKVNSQAGRDHWPGAASVLFSGGGLRVGQVVGSTDRRAMYPADRPCWPGDVLATVYNFLSIDTHQEFPDHAGRPRPLLPAGHPIGELLS